MRNRNEVLSKLKKSYPLAANIFTNADAPYFAYVNKDKKEGAIVQEMKVSVMSDSIADFLHEEVVVMAMELMKYNLNLLTELEINALFRSGRQI